MNIVLLSGGSGKRLWPLSNEIRSKQFLKVFKRDDGTHESMLQRMYRMIHDVDSRAKITIATSDNQVSSIKAQLGNAVGISVEPCRRDTFPAIALASAYLHNVLNVDENDTVVVCPVDHYVESDYFKMFQKLSEQASKAEANLVLMGIEPTYPSEMYGYIVPKENETISLVKEFKEKPNKETAQRFIREGALWNSGVFAFRLGYILNISRRVLGYNQYKQLSDHYNSLKKISFDYAVAEKEKNIQVIRFAGQWKDIGSWNMLSEVMNEEVAGNAVAVECNNTHVINELQIPLIALGVENLAIAATPDGILVTDKQKSEKLKDIVVDQRPMCEKRVWGEYQVLDYRLKEDGQNFLTKHLTVFPGKHISYQTHKHRAEIWTFVDGIGKLILNDEIKTVTRGETIYIHSGMKHAIKADTELHIIEVQIGDELTEEDIVRLDWDWNSTI